METEQEIDLDPWVRKLKCVGLNSYEAKIYLSLLGYPPTAVSSIVRNSLVPHSRAYAVLDSLVDKGFAVRVLGGVKRYMAIDPEKAFANYQDRVGVELEYSGVLMSRLATQAPLCRPYAEGSTVGSSSLEGNVVAVMKEVAGSVTDELLVATNIPESISLITGAGKLLKRRGVHSRWSICQGVIAGSPNKFDVATVAQQLDLDDRLRVHNDIPFFYAVIDSQAVVVDQQGPDGSVVRLPNAGLARILKTLFEKNWLSGTECYS